MVEKEVPLEAKCLIATMQCNGSPENHNFLTDLYGIDDCNPTLQVVASTEC